GVGLLRDIQTQRRLVAARPVREAVRHTVPVVEGAAAVRDREGTVDQREPRHIEDPATRRRIVQTEVDEVHVRVRDFLGVRCAVAVVRPERYAERVRMTGLARNPRERVQRELRRNLACVRDRRHLHRRAEHLDLLASPYVTGIRRDRRHRYRPHGCCRQGAEEQRGNEQNDGDNRGCRYGLAHAKRRCSGSASQLSGMRYTITTRCRLRYPLRERCTSCSSRMCSSSARQLRSIVFWTSTKPSSPPNHGSGTSSTPFASGSKLRSRWISRSWPARSRTRSVLRRFSRSMTTM